MIHAARARVRLEPALRGAARLEWVREITAYLGRYVDLPLVSFPSIVVPPDPAALATEQIEDLATEVRRAWRLGDGPISNATWLLENHGAIMTRAELGTPTLDGFSCWSPDDRTPYVFLGSDKESAVRSRLDAAHELGHLILHRAVAKSGMRRPANHRLYESQAYRFGAAFLLPARSFAEELYVPTIEALRGLKSRWLVSIGMMLHRSADLGLVTKDQAQRMWISYTRRGWRKGEPLDDSIPVEEPRVLKRAFQILIEQAVRTGPKIVADLQIPGEDIEELAGLPSGFLSERSPDIRLHEPSGAPNKIMTFPCRPG